MVCFIKLTFLRLRFARTAQLVLEPVQDNQQTCRKSQAGVLRAFFLGGLEHVRRCNAALTSPYRRHELVLLRRNVRSDDQPHLVAFGQFQNSSSHLLGCPSKVGQLASNLASLQPEAAEIDRSRRTAHANAAVDKFVGMDVVVSISVKHLEKCPGISSALVAYILSQISLIWLLEALAQVLKSPGAQKAHIASSISNRFRTVL